MRNFALILTTLAIISAQITSQPVWAHLDDPTTKNCDVIGNGSPFVQVPLALSPSEAVIAGRRGPPDFDHNLGAMSIFEKGTEVQGVPAEDRVLTAV